MSIHVYTQAQIYNKQTKDKISLGYLKEVYKMLSPVDEGILYFRVMNSTLLLLLGNLGETNNGTWNKVLTSGG